MRRLFAAALTLLVAIETQPAFASDAEQILKDTIAALQSKNVAMFGKETRGKLRSTQQSPRQVLLAAGRVREIKVLDETLLPFGLVIEGQTVHPMRRINWMLTYSTETQLVEIAEFSVSRVSKTPVRVAKRPEVSLPGQAAGSAPVAKKAAKKAKKFKNGDTSITRIGRSAEPLAPTAPPQRVPMSAVIHRAPASITAAPQAGSAPHIVRPSPSPQPGASNDSVIIRDASAPLRAPSPIDPLLGSTISRDACARYPQLCTSADTQTVEFLFATTRQQMASQKVAFTGERQAGITFGAARVRIPAEHVPGEIKLPKKLTLWGYTLWEQKVDEAQHFVIKSIVKLDETTWGDFIKRKRSNEALIFVHGFNNSFEDALYRHAQIIWDLQYTRGMSVLFSWASNGKTLDYVYDRDSAEGARNRFVQVLRKLKTEYGIEKVHVLAHSMGNFVVLPALEGEARSANPLKIAEIIMAAPDVDSYYFREIAPAVRKIAGGMTLYASSADKALLASKSVAAGIPRAGDVPAEGPITLPDMDTIDVTALGNEMLGLNHDVFAKSPTVMADIKALLASSLRPPASRRTPAIHIVPAPEGVIPTTYWRYIPLPVPRPDLPTSQSP